MPATAAPPRPARPAPRRGGVPARTVAEIAGMAATFGASCLALAAGALTAHVVLGLAFAAITVLHVARRIRTVRAIARKGWGRMQERTRRRMAVNAVSTVSALALVPSGLLSWAGLGGGGLHGAAAFALSVIVGTHLLQHRAWLARLAAQLPLRRPAAATT
ncbi:MAG: hypothetical protein U0237_03030 [Thermoleophilia bacterium]